MDHIGSMTGGYVFTGVCLFGGGVPWPVVSPRRGGNPSQVSVLDRGHLGQGPSPRWMGVPPGQDWMGVPPGQDWMGVLPCQGLDGVQPPPLGTGWGTPSQARTGWGTPPPEQLCLDGLCRGRHASCGFPQEDFIVFHYKIIALGDGRSMEDGYVKNIVKLCDLERCSIVPKFDN